MMDYWVLDHYWELRLFLGIAMILSVFLIIYFAASALFLWLGAQRTWRDKRKARLTTEDTTYYLKGYDARPNIRRA
jgi:hypothetical protein